LEEVVRERHVVLVGGQAVSVWLGQFADRLGDDLATAPVVSRDIDFLGNASDLRRAGKLLGGRVHVAGWDDHTPLAGAAMFLDSDGYKGRASSYLSSFMAKKLDASVLGRYRLGSKLRGAPDLGEIEGGRWRLAGVDRSAMSFTAIAQRHTSRGIP
jgi:hypothetical protein